MQASRWSRDIIVNILLRLLIISSFAQVFGRVLPTRDSSDVPGHTVSTHHAASVSGVDLHHAAFQEHIVPDNTTKLEKRVINICCFSVPIPSWCTGCGDDSSPEPEPAPAALDPRAESSYPPMSEIVQKVRDYGTVGQGRISLFYSNLGGGNAITTSLQWCNCHEDLTPANPGRVYYNTAFSLYNDFVPYQNRFSGDDQENNLLPKLFSQAFAEVTTGDVYFFTPSDSEPGSDISDPALVPKTVTWVGWEYPALTRNSGVTKIWRVDPRPGFDNDPKLIWTQGDAPSSQEPNGFIPDAVF